MKSIRTDPLNHAARGDERIRTAEQALGAEMLYEAPSEHVYVIGAYDDDRVLVAVKVGVSSDPIMRLNNLQVANWHQLELLMSWEASPGTETRLHRSLIRWHWRGEWFRACDDLMRVLDEAVP